MREFFFFSFLISLSPSLSLSLSLFRFLFFFFDPCCFFVFLSLSLEKDAHSETKFHFSKYKTTKQKMQAVHPYSTPIAPSQLPSNKASSSPLPPLLQLLPPILHFSDLRRLSELQAERAAEAPSKIVGVRVGADKGARAPQAVVAATEQGGSVVRSRGQVEEATPSTLFVFNPAEPHAGSMAWSKRWQYRSMYLTQAALDRVAADLGIEQVGGHRPAGDDAEAAGIADGADQMAFAHPGHSASHDGVAGTEEIAAARPEIVETGHAAASNP